MFDRFARASEVVSKPTGPAPRFTPPPPRQRFAGTETADAPPPRTIARSQPVLDPAHVTRIVARADAVPQATRSGGNKDGYLHLSSLIGMCEREQFISQHHGLRSYKSVAGPMKIIWAIGRAVEKHIRNSVLTTRDRRGIYGHWQCRCGASNHRGEFPRDRTCPVCEYHLTSYREPLLVSHEHRVIGSPDITLIELGWYLATEIKSMNKDQFDKLEAPLADHVMQAMGYRHLYALMGFPVLDIVSVVYARKDFKFGGSRAVYKEYHVRADQWQGQIEAMFASAKRVAQANDTGLIPDRVCTVSTCTRAKDCERANLCFSL